MELLTITSREAPEKRPPPLLAHGFRPFFLLAGAYGALFLGLWVGIFSDIPPESTGFRPTIWHGHEMVFGFALAAVCGFLLTSTATWSRIPPVTGRRLAIVVGAWAMGRIAMWLAFLLSSPTIALLDLALIPVLGWSIAPVLFSRGNRQNLIFLAMLILFFIADLLIHLEPFMESGGTAGIGLRFGVNLMMVLIVIVIGRIVPTFCRVARLGEGGGASRISHPLLEAAAIGSVALLALLHLAASETPWAGWLALAAALIQLIRMLNWRAGKLLLKPYIFALHLGYAWLIAGLSFMGIASLGGPIPEISALHAVTAGGIGTMILAVMSIVGLLHTGRPAELHPLIIFSFLLVSCAALLRVSAPVLLPELYQESLIVSGALWAAAFGIYVGVYWPILSKARPDGIPG